ncbi:MAG: DUF3634 family protein [Planctomycetota bacterium]|nr:DUF3634 family protein [Planctomycetota bacterium]
MEVYLIVALIVVVSIGVLKWASRRALTICELRADGGETKVVRGGVTPSVMRDLREVVERAELDRVRIFVMRDRDGARVEVKGAIETHVLQRIRNVVGSVPFARLRAKG